MVSDRHNTFRLIVNIDERAMIILKLAMIHYKIMHVLVNNSHGYNDNYIHESDEYNPTDTKLSHVAAASSNFDQSTQAM